MRSYVLEVVHGGAVGTTYVVMKYPRLQPGTGTGSDISKTTTSSEFFFRPDRLPFAAAVTIRSSRERRIEVVRRAVDRISNRGLAWTSLFANQKVFTRVQRIGKRRYIVYFQFDEAFRAELPPS